MNKQISPSDIARPFRNIYSHAIEVATGARLLLIAGQTPDRPDGSTPVTFAEQAEQAFFNLEAVLRAAMMDTGGLVKMNVFLKDIENLAILESVQERFLNGAKPAITLVAVSSLAQPQWLIEIDGMAAGRSVV